MNTDEGSMKIFESIQDVEAELERLIDIGYEITPGGLKRHIWATREGVREEIERRDRRIAELEAEATKARAQAEEYAGILSNSVDDVANVLVEKDALSERIMDLEAALAESRKPITYMGVPVSIEWLPNVVRANYYDNKADRMWGICHVRTGDNQADYAALLVKLAEEAAANATDTEKLP